MREKEKKDEREGEKQLSQFLPQNQQTLDFNLCKFTLAHLLLVAGIDIIMPRY